MSLPFRQIHLDFHTSEHIPGVGRDFDPQHFARTLKAAAVDSVTLFAKCHHGWSYYPTKIGQVHPHLEVPDLLGEMIQACRAENIQTPVYITVQWDELTAREHPEWRVIRAQHGSFQALGRSGGDADLNQFDPQWHPLSVIHEAFVERLIAQSKEVVERYDPNGLFLDILLPWQDVSQKNLDRMWAKGLNPESEKDRLQNDREVIVEYYAKFGEAMRAFSPQTRIFHNSGHIFKGERERWEYFSHLELESLPTGGWGYDHFPMSARYATQLGKEFLGMTGKFHTMWGEFGGYKTPIALEYECAQMVAMGARCSIGDQLHPNGKIDPATYEIIRPAYERVRQLEPYLTDAQPVAQIGILSGEAHHQSRDYESADVGAGRVLLETQQMFELLDWQSDLESYALLILPDTIRLQPDQAKRLEAYLAQGGKIVSTGTSLLAADQDTFAVSTGAKYEGMRAFEPDFIVADAPLTGPSRMVASPFVQYARGIAMSLEGGEAIAGLHDPYFNRSWDKFCSHQHFPYRPERNATQIGAVRHGNVIHFAHPLFKEYYNTGQPLTRALVSNAIDALLGGPEIVTNLPSSGRVSWMRQPEANRDIMHLLYAQTQLRGNEVAGWTGGQSIEILEDAVPLYDVEVAFPASRPVQKVVSAYDPETEIPFAQAADRVSVKLPKLFLHDALVVQF